MECGGRRAFPSGSNAGLSHRLFFLRLVVRDCSRRFIPGLRLKLTRSISKGRSISKWIFSASNLPVATPRSPYKLAEANPEPPFLPTTGCRETSAADPSTSEQIPALDIFVLRPALKRTLPAGAVYVVKFLKKEPPNELHDAAFTVVCPGARDRAKAAGQRFSGRSRVVAG